MRHSTMGMPLTETLLKSRIICILDLTFFFRCVILCTFLGSYSKIKIRQFFMSEFCMISYKVFKIDYLLTIYYMATFFFIIKSL